MTTAGVTKVEKAIVHTGGVNFGNVNPKLVMKALKALKLPAVKGETKEAATARLAAHFQTEGNEVDGDVKELVECDHCNGRSFKSLAACPFCGESDADTASGTERPSVPSVMAGTNGAAMKPAAARAASAITSAKVLDDAVLEIQRLKSSYVGSYWDLGRKVLEVYDLGLWKMRLDPETGKARWKGFDSFCHNELGLVPNQAYDLMDVAKKFTREQMMVLGKSKLKLISQAPDEDQPGLLEKAEKGATKREVEAEVRKIKKEKKHRKPNRSTGSAKAGVGGGRPAKKLEDKITVASLVGRVTVKLFKKPENVKKFDPKDLKRAKRFADVPWGTHVTENGVRQSYTLRENGAGEWDLVVETSREEPAE